MSPIHSIQDLTIDLSRLGALELNGNPTSTSPSYLKLSFSDSRPSDALRMDFQDYSQAQRMYDRLTRQWVAFERKRAQAKLIQEAEKELYF